MVNQTESNKIKIPATPSYVLAFLLLAFLCYEAHEFIHHLTGAMLCGGFGSMTFSTFEARPYCFSDAAVTLSGPLLSFAFAWLGDYWLSKRRNMLFSYTLIFASSAHLRFPLPLMRSGDEWLVMRTTFEQPNPYLVAGILFLLALPPLVSAYRSLENHRRVLTFTVSFIAPFIILFLMPIMDGLISETGMTWLGIPLVILVVNTLVAFGLYIAGRKILNIAH